MTLSPQTWPESEYRKTVQETLDRIEGAFDEIDPDIAECTQSLGVLTITYLGGHKCILSGQPSVRQLWLALASAGVAHHFDYHPQTRSWQDDKKKGIELISYLTDFFEGTVRVRLKI